MKKSVCQVCHWRYMPRGWHDNDEQNWDCGVVFCPGKSLRRQGVPLDQMTLGKDTELEAMGPPEWCRFPTEHVILGQKP